MNRRTFLLGAGAAAMAQTQRPNIVFILSDDRRFGFIGAMGHPGLKGKTPNMDRMIRDGAHFRNAFVTTSRCSPSRASILTSQYCCRRAAITQGTSANGTGEATIGRSLGSSVYVAATVRACLPSMRASARCAKRSNVLGSPAARCSCT